MRRLAAALILTLPFVVVLTLEAAHSHLTRMRGEQRLMSAITHRSIVLSAAALFIGLTSAAAGQSPETAPAGEPPSSAIRFLRAEQDFRVLNLPSTLRLPRHGSSFQLTHRFNGNLRQGSFDGNASNLFGLDQGAVVGFEYRFGIARTLQAAAYRTAIDKTFQFYGKYDAVRQGTSLPVSLSALVSVEGADNFQGQYSPALGLVASHIVGDRLAVYASPIWVHNTAASLDLDRNTFFVGIGGRVRVASSVYIAGEVVPRVAGYRPGKPSFGFAIEKRVGGHFFQLNVNNSQGTTFGQLARGGFADSLYLGFNLARKFL